MSTLYVNAGAFSHIANLAQPKPSITQWQRLESDPSELDLAAGLEARLADPLWLIGRQWQFAELKGENAGMPIVARLVGASGALTLDGTSGDRGSLHEPVIEAEPARQVLPSLAIEAALDLREALVDAEATPAFDAFRHAFPLEFAAHDSDSAGRDFLLLLGEHAFDVLELAAKLAAELGSDGTLTRLPDEISLPAGLHLQALEIAETWLADWSSLLVDPAGVSRWQPARLEYSAQLSAATPDGIVRIDVPEYAHGRFDWWAMDVAGAPSGLASVATVDETRIPVPVRFAGMAADRLFEIEPDGVSLLTTNTGPTGVLAMLLVEYAVAASNDWYQVPLTLPYGTAFGVGTLTVTDSFGVPTQIGPATAKSDAWSMFEVTAGRFGDPAAPLFLFPAATAHTLESEPIEEVALFRDEMANLAWAVERLLPGLTPAPRRPAGEVPLGQALALIEAADAALIYRLQTPVPLNWYPLSPELPPGGVDGATVLRLRSLRRFGDGAPSGDGPTAAVLDAGAGGELRIDEREIPRSGILVTRSFQVARDAAGGRQVWLGRQKRVHRGEGTANRRTDLLEPSER
jgi:hypothetical protein